MYGKSHIGIIHRQLFENAISRKNALQRFQADLYVYIVYALVNIF